MNLDTLIYQQNPQWLDKDYLKPELNWFSRPVYKNVLSWLDKRLIIALTGLRRTGKTTILNQIKYHLEEKIAGEQILYFSFEKSQVKFHPDTLREILTWYFETFRKSIPQKLQQRVYIFFDEIQYIPYWQDILKTYYDQNQQIKFLLSGSSSLFIKERATESLAGRLVQIIIPPLSFVEFRQIKNILPTKEIKKTFRMRPNLVNSYFEEYLKIGQFPELVKEGYTQEQAKTYLDLIEEKILEQDLPKIYPIKRVDILRLIFNFLKTNHGNILEFRNVTNDLGVDLKTTIRYFDYLKKAYLINFCLNSTKKTIKTARTAKKIYLASTNLSDGTSSQKVENYVYVLLSTKFETKFFRKGNFEVDFLSQVKNEIIPFEVKYQEKIEEEDYKNLVKLGIAKKSKKAYLVSKNLLKYSKRNNLMIYTIPACLMEEVL